MNCRFERDGTFPDRPWRNWQHPIDSCHFLHLCCLDWWFLPVRIIPNHFSVLSQLIHLKHHSGIGIAEPSENNLLVYALIFFVSLHTRPIGSDSLINTPRTNGYLILDHRCPCRSPLRNNDHYGRRSRLPRPTEMHRPETDCH